ncbi:MAG: VWA domain-containing protein [Crocinitomicaceae bacterium]|nr:VWA domain-containing protein [Crocinitomicaceae bacterium]
MFQYEYVYKEAFWLFLILPAIVFWYLYNESGRFKNIHISSFENLEKKKFNFVAFFRHMNLFLLLVGFTFVILALARPHLPSDIDEYQKKNMEGIDIVLAIDASGSMKAQDFKPNRLEAAKEVAINFIDERPADRIGLVVFQAEAYTQAPLTTDHELLKSLFTEVQNTAIITDGTAIGEGLATSINRLRESDAKSKVIILLTDGENNSGDTDPLTAANVAKENNICVYTIGVGQDGTAPYPVETPFGTMMQDMEVTIDEELLTEIADYTGGKYYRAKNETELEKIYDEIDQLEKSKVKVLEFKVSPPEKYYGLLLLGIFLILIYRTVQHTFLKSIP